MNFFIINLVFILRAGRMLSSYSLKLAKPSKHIEIVAFSGQTNYYQGRRRGTKMPLMLYTLRGKHTGRFYYATGFTMAQAAKELGISPKSLILERSEVMPPKGVQILQEPSISSNTVPYHSQRK